MSKIRIEDVFYEELDKIRLESKVSPQVLDRIGIMVSFSSKSELKNFNISFDGEDSPREVIDLLHQRVYDRLR